MSIDTIGNLLTIIRNGILVSKRVVVAPFSREKLGILQALKDEGFIKDFQTVQTDDVKSSFKIFLKYYEGESVIHELIRVSRPGRRHYEKAKSITPVIGGLGRSILSTSRGIMTDKQAKELRVGGEVLCRVW